MKNETTANSTVVDNSSKITESKPSEVNEELNKNVQTIQENHLKIRKKKFTPPSRWKVLLIISQLTLFWMLSYDMFHQITFFQTALEYFKSLNTQILSSLTLNSNVIKSSNTETDVTIKVLASFEAYSEVQQCIIKAVQDSGCRQNMGAAPSIEQLCSMINSNNKIQECPYPDHKGESHRAQSVSQFLLNCFIIVATLKSFRDTQHQDQEVRNQQEQNDDQSIEVTQNKKEDDLNNADSQSSKNDSNFLTPQKKQPSKQSLLAKAQAPSFRDPTLFITQPRFSNGLRDNIGCHESRHSSQFQGGGIQQQYSPLTQLHQIDETASEVSINFGGQAAALGLQYDSPQDTPNSKNLTPVFLSPMQSTPHQQQKHDSDIQDSNRKLAGQEYGIDQNIHSEEIKQNSADFGNLAEQTSEHEIHFEIQTQGQGSGAANATALQQQHQFSPNNAQLPTQISATNNNRNNPSSFTLPSAKRQSSNIFMPGAYSTSAKMFDIHNHLQQRKYSWDLSPHSQLLMQQAQSFSSAVGRGGGEGESPFQQTEQQRQQQNSLAQVATMNTLQSIFTESQNSRQIDSRGGKIISQHQPSSQANPSIQSTSPRVPSQQFLPINHGGSVSPKSLFYPKKQLEFPQVSLPLAQANLDALTNSHKMFSGIISGNKSSNALPHINSFQSSQLPINGLGVSATQVLLPRGCCGTLQFSNGGGSGSVIQQIHTMYKNKISKLEHQLNSTKIFLNMVIHDMRNPTNSIEYALKEILAMLKSKSTQQPNPDYQHSTFVREKSLQLPSGKHESASVNAPRRLSRQPMDDNLSQASKNTPGKGNQIIQDQQNLQIRRPKKRSISTIKTPDHSLDLQITLVKNDAEPVIPECPTSNSGNDKDASPNSGSPLFQKDHNKKKLQSQGGVGVTLQQMVSAKGVTTPGNAVQQQLIQLQEVSEIADDSSLHSSCSKMEDFEEGNTPGGSNYDDLRLGLGMLSNFKRKLGAFHSEEEKAYLSKRHQNLNNQIIVDKLSASQFESKELEQLQMANEKIFSSEAIQLPENKIRSNNLLSISISNCANSSNPDAESQIQKVVRRLFLQKSDLNNTDSPLKSVNQSNLLFNCENPQTHPLSLSTAKMANGIFNKGTLEELKMLHGQKQMQVASLTPGAGEEEGPTVAEKRSKGILIQRCSVSNDRKTPTNGEAAAIPNLIGQPIYTECSDINCSKKRKLSVKIIEEEKQAPVLNNTNPVRNGKLVSGINQSQKSSKNNNGYGGPKQLTLYTGLIDNSIGSNDDEIVQSRISKQRLPTTPTELKGQIKFRTSDHIIEEENESAMNKSKFSNQKERPSRSQTPAGCNCNTSLSPYVRADSNHTVQKLNHAFSKSNISRALNPQASVHNLLGLMSSTLGGIIMSQEERKQCESLVMHSLLSSTMLLNLINDLLDLAKIENSQFNFNTTQFNLHEVIQKAIETLDFSAQQKNIKVDYTYEEENIGYFMEISGDDNRYLQILLNFLSNALKFTNSNGTITIETRLIDSQQIIASGIKNIQKSNIKLEVFQTIVDPEYMQKMIKRSKSLDGVRKKKHRSSNLVVKPFCNNNNNIPFGDIQQQQDQNKFLLQRHDIKKQQHKPCLDDNSINHDQQHIQSSIRKTSFKKNEKSMEQYIKFEIRVKDSGVGISPENLDKLFMNFSKLEEHAEGNKRGTGLGLSICKSLIELMGGTVTVESEKDVGTTFIMQLQTRCKVPNARSIKQWFKAFRVRTKKGDIGGDSDSQYHVFSPRSQQPNPHFLQITSMFQNLFAVVSDAEEINHQNSDEQKVEDMNHDQFSFAHQQKSIHSQNQGGLSQFGADNSNSSINGEELLRLKSETRQNNTSNGGDTTVVDIPTFAVGGGDFSFIQVVNNNISSSQGSYKRAEPQFKTQKVKPPHQQKKEGLLETGFQFENNDEFQISNFKSAGTDKVPFSMHGREEEKDQQQNENDNEIPKIQFQVLRALVANDDMFQLQIVSTIMQNQGFEVSSAENGLVALQLFQEARAKQEPFDVILLDLDMPIMNGFDACKRIRQNFEGGESAGLQQLVTIDRRKSSAKSQRSESEIVVDNLIHERSENKGRVLIIALSALITDSVKEKGLSCGFDDFIEMPITPDKVRDQIKAKLEARLQQEAMLISQIEEDESHNNLFYMQSILNPYLYNNNNNNNNNNGVTGPSSLLSAGFGPIASISDDSGGKSPDSAAIIASAQNLNNQPSLQFAPSQISSVNDQIVIEQDGSSQMHQFLHKQKLTRLFSGFNQQQQKILPQFKQQSPQITSPLSPIKGRVLSKQLPLSAGKVNNIKQTGLMPFASPGTQQMAPSPFPFLNLAAAQDDYQAKSAAAANKQKNRNIADTSINQANFISFSNQL